MVVNHVNYLKVKLFTMKMRENSIFEKNVCVIIVYIKYFNIYLNIETYKKINNIKQTYDLFLIPLK